MFRLAKQRPIQLRLFIAFLLIPTLYIATTYMTMYRYMSTDVPSVDYNEVNQRGQLAKGTVKGIEFSKTPDQGDQPTVISYTYPTDDGTVSSKFQTLKPGQIEVGNSIDVKYYDGESIILGLEPYSFPFYIYFIPAVPFLNIGILFAIYFLFTIGRQVRLFRRAVVRDAELISFTPTPGFPFTVYGQKVQVRYRYQISGNNKVEGESTTRDLSITKEKKPGDTIKIFVAPDNEFVTCLISTADVKANNWKID